MILARKKINIIILGRWNLVSCFLGWKNKFLKELKLRLYWGCLQDVRNIEMLEFMILRIQFKYDVSIMIDCVLMFISIVLIYVILGEESKISLFLVIICIIGIII